MRYCNTFCVSSAIFGCVDFVSTLKSLSTEGSGEFNLSCIERSACELYVRAHFTVDNKVATHFFTYIPIESFRNFLELAP